MLGLLGAFYYQIQEKILDKIPYIISFIGLCFLVFSLIVKLNSIKFQGDYFNIIFSISIGWCLGGVLLSNSRKKIREIGFIGIY